MPAYHSKYVDAPQKIGNIALLPLRTAFRGPAPKTEEEDIIDESLFYFKANIFFRSYEVKCPSKAVGLKEMATLALSKSLPIPGDQGFPMNAVFKAPSNRNEEETMRSYLQQLRQELGVRLCDKVFDPETDRPSKWWTCFAKRRFMEKSLLPPGVA
ncbi:actin protein 2:3 complex subunit 3 [Trichuris trichiura]|uniref:Actin-related protein 2/3 complex subunit 3 n=1 Tax=Trichuris trichiura TaxID=36087 RepID=A0A077ZDS1_TRITR|nr:actin protein 2:3 complex subunit 3 [Trichuris trichiura]